MQWELINAYEKEQIQYIQGQINKIIKKEHFKNLLRNSLKVTDRPFAKIINNQLDLKLE